MMAGDVEHSLTTCEEINDRIKIQNLFLIPLRLNSRCVKNCKFIPSTSVIKSSQIARWGKCKTCIHTSIRLLEDTSNPALLMGFFAC